MKDEEYMKLQNIEYIKLLKERNEILIEKEELEDRIKKAIRLLDPIDIDTYGDDTKDYKNRCAIDNAIEILEGEDK